MVSETDNTRVVSDNTVTTPLCRNLLAKFTTGEGLDKLDQRRHRVVGWSGRPEFRVHRCRDRSPSSGTCRISGYNTKPRQVSRHRSPMSRSQPRRRRPPRATAVVRPTVAVRCRPVDRDPGFRRDDERARSWPAGRVPANSTDHRGTKRTVPAFRDDALGRRAGRLRTRPSWDGKNRPCVPVPAFGEVSTRLDRREAQSSRDGGDCWWQCRRIIDKEHL